MVNIVGLIKGEIIERGCIEGGWCVMGFGGYCNRVLRVYNYWVLDYYV